ncbi:MAG: metallophosphoesterase [Oscillospiraceae bacterium]|nr:metallophosphoesterase [Oscillospiraceae bacterium]
MRVPVEKRIGPVTGLGRLRTGAVSAAVFLHRQNTALKVRRYVYSSPRLPNRFRGFRIRQISDYHNTSILENRVVNMTAAEGPDIIVVTGDLVDCRKTDITAGLSLIKRLAEIAPVYYVTGNHEAKIPQPEKLKRQIARRGATVMDGAKINLYRGEGAITLRGVRDPRFYAESDHDDGNRQYFRRRVLKFMETKENFTLLLSHRPEFIHTYRDAGIDLALTGHAHGGQFGIPFTDMGVFVPNQGLFPEYAAGMKQLDNTTMVISRGIGNSVFPFRLFNYPEIVTVEFE